MKFPRAFQKWVGSFTGRPSAPARPVRPQRQYQRDHWGSQRETFVVPQINANRPQRTLKEYGKWIGHGDFQQLNLDWVKARQKVNQQAFKMYAESLVLALESFANETGRTILVDGPSATKFFRHELVVRDIMLEASYFPGDRVIAVAPVFYRYILAELTAEDVERHGDHLRYVRGQFQRQLFGIVSSIDLMIISAKDIDMALSPLQIHCSGDDFPDATISAQVLYSGALKPNGLLALLINVEDLERVKNLFEGSALKLVTQKNTVDLLVDDSSIEAVIEEPDDSGYMLLVYKK